MQTSTTRLKKPLYLCLARGIWILLALMAIVIVIAFISRNYTYFRTPCNEHKLEEQARCFGLEQALAQFGLKLNFLSIFVLLGTTVEVLPWFIVGIVIFWKKSDGLFGLLFSLMLMIAIPFNIDRTIRESAVFSYPNLLPIANVANYIGSLLLILWYRFPDGHFIPRWLRWSAIVWIVIQSGYYFFNNTAFNLYKLPSPWGDLINPLFSISIIYSSVYRYRHITEQTQRQQIKWVVFSVAILAVIVIGNSLIDVLINLNIMPWTFNVNMIWILTYQPLLWLSSMFLAVCMGFSILRYRLWDIDFIINRSLVYGSLTVLLALVFGGSLFLVSRIVEGQNFVLAFGITALIAGTSFNPARRRIQRFVDQRFYHINIDYQKTPLDIPSNSATQVLRGTQFGVYQNLELIGRGGMAEVYKSTHPTLHKLVAIKILPDHLAAEEDFRKRFTREAQIVSKLEHPNIVRMFDSGENNGKHYMVMEYLTGKDLSEFLRANGKLTLSQALPLIQQIASALDYAHQQGLVHRDIKPSNVLLDTTTNGMRAILTDFGIAKIIQSNTAMTKTGGMLGTFDYMAPEQIQESANVDGRADIYALGIMVYQMLTGDVPFKHNNPGALLIAHLTQPPPDACKQLPNLPEKVCDAIQRAMAKKPDERFDTATTFVNTLSSAI
jgi:serine/threonine-protein kinase